MRLDIAGLLKDVGREVEIDESVKVDFSDDGIEIEGKPLVRLRIVNTGELVIASGTIDAKVVLACSRCLNKFSQKLHIEVCEEFSENAGELNKESTDPEELEIWPIKEDKTIDLTEVIRQNIVLGLPMQVRCSEDCSIGIIAKKEEKKIDPRLLKLKEVFKEEKKNARTKEKTQ